MTSQNQTTSRAALVVIAKDDRFATKGGKAVSMAVMNDGATVGFEPAKAQAVLGKNVVSVDGGFRSRLGGIDPKTGKERVYSVNYATTSWSKATEQYAERKGATPRAVATYANGKQVEVRLQDAVSLICGQYTPVMTKALILDKADGIVKEFDRLPTASEAGIGDDEDVVYVLGVNYILNADALVSRFLVPADFTSDVKSISWQTVKDLVADGSIIDRDAAELSDEEVAALVEAGWRKQNRTLLPTDRSLYTAGWLNYKLGVFTCKIVGRAENGTPRLKAVGFTSAANVYSEVFGVEVTVPMPERRHTKAQAHTSFRAADAFATRGRR